MRSFVILFALLAFSIATQNDISVTTSFGHATERNANNQQFINVHNLLPTQSDVLGNSISNVHFQAAGIARDSYFVASYPNGAKSGSVGTILSGAAGSGSFAVLASAGTYLVGIEVTYTLNGKTKSAVFGNLTLTVSAAGSKREIVEEYYAVEVVSIEQAREDGVEVRALESRQPGNNDISLAPASYAAEADASTWNSFAIKVGSSSITTVTWVLLNGDGVGIGYYNGVNTASSIAHNSTLLTYVSFSSASGTYNINNTVSYKIGTTTKMFWTVTLLGVSSGDSSLGRSALALKESAHAQSAGQMIRVEYAFGAAVAGVAIVAVIAVVAAMVVIRKKNTPTITV